MAVYSETFDITLGVNDAVPVNRVGDGFVSWARNADFGYPGQVRILPGMTRHVTAAAAANTFTLDTGSDRVSNIFDVQIDGSNYLLCLKGDGTTHDRLWDITEGGTATSIIQVTRPGATDDLYQKPWPVAIWDDEVFFVNGQATVDVAGACTSGMALSRSAGAWTTSEIGVLYGAATDVPTVTQVSGDHLKTNGDYTFRILGYDTTKGAYGALASSGGTSMEATFTVGSTASALQVVVAASATTLGVDELRIYRTARNGGEFFHEGTLTGTDDTFTTTLTDQELVQKTIYNEGGQPPDTFYLIARHNERLVAIGTTDRDRLYFSGVDQPHDWGPDNYRELPNLGKPVALASRGTLIHIHYDTGLIVTLTGQDASNAQIATDCKEIYGSVNTGGIVEATFRSYFVGNAGIMQFTGQACPKKISHAIDGTWEGLTKSSLAECSAVLNDRARGKEYWVLFPEDNLLVHVPVEGMPQAEIGTKIGVSRCHGTALGRQRTGGETKIYLGTKEGAVFQIDTGTAHGTEAQLLSTTLTDATSTELVVSGAQTTSFGHLSMPFTITSGAAEGNVGWVTGYASATTLTVTPEFTTTPAAGDRVVIGALPHDIYTKFYDRGRPSKWKRWSKLRVNVQDDDNSNNRTALLNVYAVVMDTPPKDARGDDLDWALVGQIDVQRPENNWIGLYNNGCEMVGCFLGLRLTTMDYQVARNIQSIDLEYEYYRTGPE